MKFLKNRTVLGVVCILISLIICFAITPLFNASKRSVTRIVRIKNDVKIGQQITEKDVEVVEVGAYNFPSEILQNSEDVVGKYAASEMIKGDYILPVKISDTPASENAYLYGLTGKKRAISITIPSFAGGLSGKLISGDIVSIIAVDYKEMGETLVPDELQYVEVIAVTDKKGNDEETVTVKPDGEEETELPETVTLLVTPEQAKVLAELEAEGEIHVALVYRGTAENAQKFIDAQEKLLKELTEKEKDEKEDTEQSEVPQNTAQSEIAEDKTDTKIPEISDVKTESESNFESKSDTSDVPETNDITIEAEENSNEAPTISDVKIETESNSESNSASVETEVTADAESVQGV